MSSLNPPPANATGNENTELVGQQEQNEIQYTWKWSLLRMVIDFLVIFTAKFAALRTLAWMDRRAAVAAAAAAASAVLASATATSPATVTSTCVIITAVLPSVTATALITVTAAALRDEL